MPNTFADDPSRLGLILVTVDHSIALMTPAAQKLLDLPQEAAEQPAEEFLPAEIVALLNTEEELTLTYQRVLHVQVTPLPDGQRILTLWPVSKRAERLALLNDIIRISTTLTDRATLLQALADDAAKIIGGDGCYITLWDATQQLTIPGAAYGPMRETYQQIVLRPGQNTLTKYVLTHGHTISVPDVFDFEHLDPAIAELFPARSVICIPLRVEERDVGALLLAFNMPYAFTPEDVHWAEQAADLIALAIAKTEAFDDLRERNAHLDAYAHTVAHDLKGPVGVVLGYGDLLMEASDELSLEQLTTSYQQIRQAAQKMEEIINSLLMLAQLRHGERIEEAVDMTIIITNVIERYRLDFELRGISPPSPPPTTATVRGYGPWLEVLLSNLISNAIKYIGHDNPDPWVMIALTQEGAYAALTVQDNGLGIPEEKQATLLQAFERAHTDEASGHGLGLNIVLRILDALNGTLTIESMPGQGSAFRVTLPLYEA